MKWQYAFGLLALVVEVFYAIHAYDVRHVVAEVEDTAFDLDSSLEVHLGIFCAFEAELVALDLVFNAIAFVA